MRIEEVVGQRLREAREERGLTQEELGQRLAALLGKSWPRQTVSIAERGHRAFTALELLAFSVVLGVEVADLFRLPGDLDFVTTPAGAVPRSEIQQSAQATVPGADDLRGALRELVKAAQQMQAVGFVVDREARRMQDNLDRLLVSIHRQG